MKVGEGRGERGVKGGEGRERGEGRGGEGRGGEGRGGKREG